MSLIWRSLQALQKSPIKVKADINRPKGEKAKLLLGLQGGYAVFHPGVIEELSGHSAVSSHSQDYSQQRHVEGNSTSTSQRTIESEISWCTVVRFAKRITTSTLAHLERWHDGEVRNLLFDLQSITFDITARIMFNYDSRHKLIPLVQAFDSYKQSAINRYHDFIRFPLLIPTQHNREFQRAHRKLEEVTSRIIAERRTGKQPADPDLLSILLSYSRETSDSSSPDKQLVGDVIKLFLTIYETTAHTLTWALEYIMRHPEVETNLLAEWKRVLAGRPPCLEDFQELTYTQNVLRETLRLTPRAHLSTGTTFEEFRIGKLSIKNEDSSLLISPYPIYMDDQHYQESEIFKPERYESSAPMNDFHHNDQSHFVTTNHLIMLEMVLILATICQRFHLRHETSYRPSSTDSMPALYPTDGKQVVAERRDPDFTLYPSTCPKVVSSLKCQAWRKWI